MRAASYLGDLGGLSDHRQLVLLDPRGTGGSAVPDDPATYRCERLVDDIEALRAHLGLESIDLLGHSASADLAALYAARHPQRLRSLTLVSPATRAVGVETTDQDRRGAFALRSGEPWYAAAAAALEEIRAGRGGREQWAAIEPFAYGRWDAAAQAHAAAAPAQRNAAAAAVFHRDSAFGTAATVTALRSLAVPVLVLAGEYDAGPTPDRAAELAALFPQGEFVVQRGGAHYPWLDDPGAFTRTVRAFLDPEVHSVQAGGIRLAYRVWGDPSAPPVVLAHGRGGDSRTWTWIAGRLAADHRVYALDFRGHGLSDWPGRYSFELFRDDLHAFMEARNLSGATVVGHSLGGAAACLLAEQEPGLIGRLVIEEAPPLIPLDPRAGPPNVRTGSSTSTGRSSRRSTPSSTTPTRRPASVSARSPLRPWSSAEATAARSHRTSSPRWRSAFPTAGSSPSRRDISSTPPDRRNSSRPCGRSAWTETSAGPGPL